MILVEDGGLSRLTCDSRFNTGVRRDSPPATHSLVPESLVRQYNAELPFFEVFLLLLLSSSLCYYFAWPTH